MPQVTQGPQPSPVRRRRRVLHTRDAYVPVREVRFTYITNPDAAQLAAWRRLWDILLAPPTHEGARVGATHEHVAREGAI